MNGITARSASTGGFSVLGAAAYTPGSTYSITVSGGKFTGMYVHASRNAQATRFGTWNPNPQTNIVSTTCGDNAQIIHNGNTTFWGPGVSILATSMNIPNLINTPTYNSTANQLTVPVGTDNSNVCYVYSPALPTAAQIMNQQDSTGATAAYSECKPAAAGANAVFTIAPEARVRSILYVAGAASGTVPAMSLYWIVLAGNRGNTSDNFFRGIDGSGALVAQPISPYRQSTSIAVPTYVPPCPANSGGTAPNGCT